MHNIDEDPLLLKYFRKRHLEATTQDNYIHRFNMYHAATGLTPTLAIKEADHDEDNTPRLMRRNIVNRLDELEEYLEDHNYSENTLTTTVGIVRSFYKFYGIQLPPKNRRPPNPTPEDELKNLPDLEDIKLSLKYANVKYKAMIILMASSGLRQGDVRGLTFKNLAESLSDYGDFTPKSFQDLDELKDMLPDPIGPLTWNGIWMLKRKRRFKAFSTPESLEYIIAYLNHHPPKRYTDKVPLFRNPWKDKALSRQTVNEYFQYLNGLCNFPVYETTIFFHPQTLRKWFGNQLKNHIGYIETRQLMGHRVQDDTGQRYLKPDYVHLKRQYYRYMDSVTIFGKVEVHDITDDKVKSMRKELDDIKDFFGITDWREGVKKD